MKFVIRFIVLCLSIFLLSKLVSGFSITSAETIKTILIVSLVMTFLNIFIKPILTLFTLPINLMTMGLFSLIINALLLWAAAWYVEGFSISNFGTAVISALIISIINFAFGYKS